METITKADVVNAFDQMAEKAKLEIRKEAVSRQSK
jgi:hypothetical protein